MTGYASAQQIGTTAGSDGAPRADRPPRLGLEIRAVNSRFLDLTLRLPDEMRQHETALRELLNAHLKRGKVELRVTSGADAVGGIAAPSPRALQQLNSAQDVVRGWLPGAAPLSVAEALALCVRGQGGASVDWPALQVLARQALDALLEARAREGERLAAMLRDRLAQLRALSTQAEPLVPQLVAQQRQRFLDRWKEAMALADGAAAPEAAQDRALSEATAFAIRIDVAEELTRLASHLDEIERLLTQGGELGKRLEFLIQELQREANTVGSKSAAMELTKISVEMKVLIEQMREQVQNVE